MKKNKMLRMASAMMILVLLTTSIIGGTFAKYTTTGSAADSARVAKWGVTITTGGSLYSDAYAKTNSLPAAWTNTPDTSSVTVAAAAQADNIVAPGTKSYGEGLSLGISGTPEVAVNVKTSITAEDIFLAKGKYGVLVSAGVSDGHSLNTVMSTHTDAVYVEGDTTGSYTKVNTDDTYVDGKQYFILSNKADVDADYFPVKYALSGQTEKTGLKAIEVAKNLAKAVKSDVFDAAVTNNCKVTYEDISADFAANTNLATAGPKLGNEKLTWEWKFNETGDSTDPADTILGNLIAAQKGTDVGYKVVSINDTAFTATALTIGTDNDYTVKNGTAVVANLLTKVDITLTVTQID